MCLHLNVGSHMVIRWFVVTGEELIQVEPRSEETTAEESGEEACRQKRDPQGHDEGEEGSHEEASGEEDFGQGVEEDQERRLQEDRWGSHELHPFKEECRQETCSH